VVSGRVHSRYQSRLADLPVAGQLVELCLTVRRFFCLNTVCGMRTFAEQVAGLTRRRARRSEPLRTMLTSIGIALADRAGVRLAAKAGIRTAVTVYCTWSEQFQTPRWARCGCSTSTTSPSNEDTITAPS
jgi:hypothetical protein